MGNYAQPLQGETEYARWAGNRFLEGLSINSAHDTYTVAQYGHRYEHIVDQVYEGPWCRMRHLAKIEPSAPISEPEALSSALICSSNRQYSEPDWAVALPPGTL